MTLFLLAHNLIKITAVICYPLLLHLYAPGVGATYQRREICMPRESERHISEGRFACPGSRSDISAKRGFVCPGSRSDISAKRRCVCPGIRSDISAMGDLHAPEVGATYQRREICMARESERHISEEEICMPRESERQRHISEGERVSDGYDFNQIYSHIFFFFFFISMNLFPYFFLF